MARPFANELVMRDAALAAAMGALPSADYGNDVGADFGDDFGFGYDDDDDLMYAGFGVAPPAAPGGARVRTVGRGMAPMAPHPAAVHPAIAKHALTVAHTNARSLMLDPNKYSTLKVEGYSFTINPTTGNIVLGTASGISGTLQPNARIRPEIVLTNVAWPGFITLTQIEVANVNALLGQTDDAVVYSFLTLGKHMKLPPMDMSTRASFSGSYTGFVPPGYTSGAMFLFGLTFQGPAALAGNG